MHMNDSLILKRVNPMASKTPKARLASSSSSSRPGIPPSTSTHTNTTKPPAPSTTKPPATSTKTPAPPTLKRTSLIAELDLDPSISLLGSASKRPTRHASTLSSTSLTAGKLSSTLSTSTLERQIITLRTAKTHLESSLAEKERTISSLERDRRWFAEREREEREARLEETSAASALRVRLEEELRGMRRRVEEAEEEGREERERRVEGEREVARVKEEVMRVTEEAVGLREEVAGLKAGMERRLLVPAKSEPEVEPTTAPTPSATEAEDARIIRTEIAHQSTYIRSLEHSNTKLTAELTRLRARHASLAVLEEENSGLRAKVDLMEGMRTRLGELEAERADWQRNSTTEAPSPLSITHALSALQLTHASLLETHGSTTSLLSQTQSQLSTLQSSLAAAEARIEEVEGRLNEAEEHRRKGEEERVVWEREVRFLGALVESYKAEESFLGDMDTKNGNESLEKMLEGYKQAKEAQASWDGLRAELEIERGKTASLERDIQTHLTSISTLTSHLSTLEQTLFDLTGHIASGLHVPPRTRVLALKDNPAEEWFQMRKEEVERVRRENGALLRRVGELEGVIAGSASSPMPADPQLDTPPDPAHPAHLIPRESYDTLLASHTSLSTLLAQKSLRLLRLKEVFQAKSAEFREAMEGLMGVKLAWYPNGGVRVTSVFDLGVSFVFQPGRSAGNPTGMQMQLIAQSEGGPQDLPALMRYWVEKEGCIPGFLASVTLECWEGRRRGAGAGGEGMGAGAVEG